MEEATVTDGPGVRVERDGPVTVVTIDRPERRNAVDGPSAWALADAFRGLSAGRASVPPRIAARAELGDGDAVTRSERWEHEMRDAFLRGYLPEGRAHPQFLPQARARLDVLLELFEAEKLFYELGYELNNRPSWVWIPLRGLVTLLRGAS